jgi:tetratricopeptide (TPR) repeat protein
MSLSARVENAVVAYATYLGMAVWPFDLAPYYPYPPGGWPAGRLAVSALALAALTALAVWQWRRRPYLLAGWLWYVGTLVPVIGLVQVGGQSYADRYTYFPMIGVALALVWAVAEAAGPARARAALAVAAVVTVLLAARAWHQTGFWKDDLALWPHNLEVTGPNALAYSNLGVALEKMKGGKKEEAAWRKEAIENYKKAVAILPDYGPARYNLALALDKQGMVEEAIAQYRETLRADPRLAEAHNNLGAALGKQGHLEEAARHYREALRLDPELALAHSNLAGALEIQGEDQESLEHYREAVRLEPGNPVALGRLGIALGKRGDLTRAVEMLRRAADLQPRSGSARFNLGIAMEKAGRDAEAVDSFRRAVDLEPKDVRNRLRLAFVLNRLGDTAGAEGQYQEALRLDPGWPEALSQQAWRLATGPNPRERDGEVAVWAAESACRVVRPPPAPYLDVLGAAYAEAGRFPEAAAAAEKALAATDAAKHPELSRAIAARLALYRDSRPFHRPPPPAPR